MFTFSEPKHANAMSSQNFNQPSLETIGRNIRRWREQKEIKCEDFAEQIGLCKGSLSIIENGQTDLPTKRISEIAKALDLTSYQLCYTDPQFIVEQWIQSEKG